MSDPAPADPSADPSVDPASGANPRVFRRLLSLLRPQWKMIAVGVALLVLYVPCELFPAAAALYVVDHLISGRETYRWMEVLFSLGGRIAGTVPLLISAVSWMAGVYLVGAAMNTVSGNLMERVAQRFILDLRNRVYAKLQGQSLSYLHRQRTGDLMSRCIGDVNELQQFIVNGIDQILAEGLIWVVTVAWLMTLDWRVTGGMVLPLIAVYFLLRVFNRRIAVIYKAARESASRVSTRLQENLSGVVVIKIFNREREEAGRFEAETRANYDDQIRATNARSLFFPFTRAIGFLSNVVMLGLGGYLILAGTSFTLGKLLAFRSVWYRLFGPIYTLARVNDMVQKSSAAGRRVFTILDAPEELPDPISVKPLPTVRGAMELRGVTFSYRGTGVPPASEANSEANGEERGRDALATEAVLHDIDLTIEPGQTVALCGPSGGGKSTVLNLLLRFYDPTVGSVTLDGHDLRSLRREELRRHFALVQQETFLFAETIADNLRYGRPGATHEEVVKAARAANAHAFISKMPDGYDTMVGERGVRLSGGQKQRISIARGFLADPAILLLDEPTSSVEPDSELAIIGALDRLMVGRTTVLTSHRPSLINQADVVYVIQDGEVVASGPIAAARRDSAWFDRFMAGAADVALEPAAEPGMVA